MQYNGLGFRVMSSYGEEISEKRNISKRGGSKESGPYAYTRPVWEIRKWCGGGHVYIRDTGDVAGK